MIRSTEVQAYAFVLPSKNTYFRTYSFILFIYMFIVSVAGVLTLKTLIYFCGWNYNYIHGDFISKFSALCANNYSRKNRWN